MAEYWCDYKNGNDGNPGSSGSPWKTLTHALGVVGNGDTIYLRGGSADDEIYLETSQTIATNNLTITAEAGHSPILTSATQEPAAGWSKTLGRTNVWETPNGDTLFRAWHGSTRLEEVADIGTCDTTPNSSYDGGATKYINVGGPAPTEAVYIVGTHTPITVSGSGVSLVNIARQWIGRGIVLSGGGATLTGCTFQYSGIGQFWLDWKIVQITSANNTLSGCTIGGPNIQTANHEMYGVTIGAAANNTIVVNTTISGCLYGVDLQVNGLTGLVVSGCTISLCRDGIRTQSTGGDMLIAYCEIFDCYHGLITMAGGTITHTVLRNRVYLTQDLPGAYGDYGIIVHVDGTQYLYHNVLAHLDKSGSGSSPGVHIDPLGAGVTLVARNNAFYSCDVGFHEAGGVVTYDLDYSGFWDCGLNYSNIGPGDQGTHDILLNPQFTDAENYDFSLTGASPYVEGGVHVPGIDDDYIGSAPDIGYLEFDPGGALAHGLTGLSGLTTMPGAGVIGIWD